MDDDEDPKVRALELRVEELRNAVRCLGDEARKRLGALGVLTAEVEQLRRENATLRMSTEEDFEAANNWRRYVATVGARRASVYLVPPKPEDGH